jgi:hypothetical protein
MVKIVIPPRGSKPQAPVAPVKKAFVPPPPRKMFTAPVQELAADAFNKPVLTTTKKVGAIIKTGTPEAKSSGLSVKITELLERYPLPPTPIGDPFILDGWQVEDIEALIEWERVGLFLPVGAGKTVMSTYICFGWGSDKVIVVVMPILIRGWVKWINSIKGSGGAVAYKGTPQKRKALTLDAGRFWIMSYGVFKNDYPHLVKLFKDVPKIALAVDEAQNIKNPATQLFRKVYAFSVGRSLLLMTGTEMNNPADAYAYVKIKTPSVYRDFGHFEQVHVAKRDFFDKVTEWRELDLMYDNLYMNSSHRLDEEVNKNRPRGRYIPFPYDLDPAHKHIYDKLAEQMLLESTDGGKVDATSTNLLLMASQQLVVNWAKYAAGTSWEESPEYRPAAFDVLDALIEMTAFDQPGKPNKFIVWTWFKETTRTVKAYLESLYPGRVAVAYSESNSDKEFARFEEDPTCAWIVAQPLSVGAGVNPQYVCYNAVFIETPDQPIIFRQAAGRIDRRGVIAPPNIWIATATGTVQGSLYSNLLNNDELVSKVKRNPNDVRRLLQGG